MRPTVSYSIFTFYNNFNKSHYLYISVSTLLNYEKLVHLRSCQITKYGVTIQPPPVEMLTLLTTKLFLFYYPRFVEPCNFVVGVLVPCNFVGEFDYRWDFTILHFLLWIFYNCEDFTILHFCCEYFTIVKILLLCIFVVAVRDLTVGVLKVPM